MQLGPGVKSTYPKFHYYVRVNIPQVAHVESIIKVIKRYAGKTSRATIIRALRWGVGPTVQIVPGLVCAGVIAYGCYPWSSNKIQIDRALVAAFEAGTDMRATKSGRLVHVAGVALLHELTHWADAYDGHDEPVPGDPTNEEGEAFERDVYGKIMNL